MTEARSKHAAPELLAPLLSSPATSVVLSDIDGTLAPIVKRPEQAAVPGGARAALAELSGRFALVGCISGRPAAEARELVGLGGIAYAGNHGLELLLPGDERVRPHPAIAGHEADAARFVAGIAEGELTAAGLRAEDKGSIWALHWRGAQDEAMAETKAREIGEAAEAAGLELGHGRKVLELRPPGAVGKDAAVAALLPPGHLTAALYAGDDRTDLDAFRGLRELVARGKLEAAVCVGVDSPEAPAELGREADLRVEGPAGWLSLMHELAG